jgi:hypothetical protein
MRTIALAVALFLLAGPALAQAPRYGGPDGRLRVALAKQPFQPNGVSNGPRTMAEGGIQKILEGMGAVVRVEEAGLTPEENTEYGGWKRLGMALGHFADIVAQNERDGSGSTPVWTRRFRTATWSWPACGSPIPWSRASSTSPSSSS